ncbi:uncharacterized protein C8Q71DRAFT_863058 [Rhodofomes roseus]|uniref:Uncharacterized protein n=1 Tax=Rhodofomes roseus TaxID=34475 RepID=A0ABQ8K0Q3_9APHY|nr:uncharacterized protein C8Q71DRAFT_863058 [Rhodofomes roseus]KAH9829679.1 hypothetical protein C8Q71DRAFT_863058 [Rhodofomes roseus]
MSVDCVRKLSEFAEGVMRENEVVDVSVESDVNESDVELFCDGKLMIAELVMFAEEVAFAALEDAEVVTLEIVVVAFPMSVVVDALEVMVALAEPVLDALAVLEEQPSPIPKTQRPDEVALEDDALAESVDDDVALNESVVVVETFAEPVEEADTVEEAESVEDEQPSPMPRMQTPEEVELALAESVVVALAEPVDAVPLLESVAVAEAVDESVAVADAVDDALSLLDEQPSPRPRRQTPEDVALAELEESLAVAESLALEESVAVVESVALAEEADAVEDALSLLVEQPSPMPRRQTPPLDVALAELDESVALEVSVALDESLALAEEADAVDDALSLVEQSPIPRRQIPPPLEVLLGSAELLADEDDASVVLALAEPVDDATLAVELGEALAVLESVALAVVEAAAVDEALSELLEQPISIPRRSTQPPDEDEAEDEALELDADDEPTDVDVAGTKAVVPDELEQPSVIPRDGKQSPPFPPPDDAGERSVWSVI